MKVKSENEVSYVPKHRAIKVLQILSVYSGSREKNQGSTSYTSAWRYFASPSSVLPQPPLQSSFMRMLLMITFASDKSLGLVIKARGCWRGTQHQAGVRSLER
jgi:hypothetical protein